MPTLISNLGAVAASPVRVSLSAPVGSPNQVGGTLTTGDNPAETLTVISGAGTADLLCNRGPVSYAHAAYSTNVSYAPPTGLQAGPYGPDFVIGNSQDFATGVGDWTHSGGTISRVDGELGLGLGALQFTPNDVNQYVELVVTADFTTGTYYLATILFYDTGAGGVGGAFTVSVDGSPVAGPAALITAAFIQASTLTWQATADSAAVTVRFELDTDVDPVNIEFLRIVPVSNANVVPGDMTVGGRLTAGSLGVTTMDVGALNSTSTLSALGNINSANGSIAAPAGSVSAGIGMTIAGNPVGTKAANVPVFDTPGSATAADCANKINAILVALVASGEMTAGG